jgi:threonine aldolase
LLEDLDGLNVENPHPDSNMVYFKLDKNRMPEEQFLERCRSQGLRFSQNGSYRFRAVAHRDITRHDVEKAAEIVSQILKK